MARFKWAVAETALSGTILLCVVFVGLNILDARLTGIALGAGSYELNPFLGMRFGSSMLLKGLLSFLIVIFLVLVERGGLLNPLSIAMLLICIWNGLTVWLWS
ncbi:MAG: DUF5658 family protein [Chloroflexota bacterium]